MKAIVVGGDTVYQVTEEEASARLQELRRKMTGFNDNTLANYMYQVIEGGLSFMFGYMPDVPEDKPLEEMTEAEWEESYYNQFVHEDGHGFCSVELLDFTSFDEDVVSQVSVEAVEPINESNAERAYALSLDAIHVKRESDIGARTNYVTGDGPEVTLVSVHKTIHPDFKLSKPFIKLDRDIYLETLDNADHFIAALIAARMDMAAQIEAMENPDDAL